MSESLPNEVRFDLWHHQACTCVAVPQPSEQGQWILFTDYDALRAERDTLKDLINVTEDDLGAAGKWRIAHADVDAEWRTTATIKSALAHYDCAIANWSICLTGNKRLEEQVADLTRKLVEMHGSDAQGGSYIYYQAECRRMSMVINEFCSLWEQLRGRLVASSRRE